MKFVILIALMGLSSAEPAKAGEKCDATDPDKACDKDLACGKIVDDNVEN